MAFPPYIPDHLDGGGLPIEFTSMPEIQRLFSYKGVLLHLDDLDATDDNYLQGTDLEATGGNYMTELIQRVTSRVMEYLAPRFSALALETIPRIREIATIMACHDLSKRRGNEPIFEDDYAEALDTLDQYRDGTLFLDVPSSGPRAAVQSFVTDSRYYRNPVRILVHSSTNTVSGQHRAWDYPFSWL